MTETRIELEPVHGLPEIKPGCQLGLEIAGLHPFTGGEVLAISQKAVSKAEGRLVQLSDVEPGTRAKSLASETGKDPRLVELILSETEKILRQSGGVLITETRQGLICANAGIDASNMPTEETVALLPRDPDASARRIRGELARAMTDSLRHDREVPAVLISDSFGRPWRIGQAETAIGCAGLNPLEDWRGREDSSGRPLTATAIAVADQIAAAADLARNKTSRTPAIVVRGLHQLVTSTDGPGAAALQRPEAEDLFR